MAYTGRFTVAVSRIDTPMGMLHELTIADESVGRLNRPVYGRVTPNPDKGGKASMQNTEQKPIEASDLSIPPGVQEIAHLGHVELLTPKPEESLHFFQDVFGLDLVERVGQSLYLRAWGDYDRVTLKLTEAPQAGLGHVGWRTSSPAALQRR